MDVFIFVLIIHSVIFAITSPTVSAYQIISSEFSTIAFDKTNNTCVLSTVEDVSGAISCALACSKRNDSQCTGFEFLENRCHLLGGHLGAKVQTESNAEDGIVYKRRGLATCESYHPGFRVVETGTEKYCLAAFQEKRLFQEAQDHCKSLNSSVTFIDSHSKMAAIQGRFENQTTMWIGAFYDQPTDTWKGTRECDVLVRDSDIWMDWPNYPWEPDKSPCVMRNINGPLVSGKCEIQRSTSVCEIFAFS